MRRALALLIFAEILSAQTFEVVSVRPSPPPADGKQTIGWILSRPGEPVDPGRVRWTSVSMKGMLMLAYHVGPDQISGPSWIDDDRYDLNATFAPSAASELPEMLRNLLADRFQLAVRTETRSRKGYALTVAKGGAHLTPAHEGAAVGNGSKDQIRAMNVTMATFCGLLSGYLKAPVKDETNISGEFDIAVNTSIADFTGLNDNDNAAGNVFSGLAEIGLKLESRPTPAPFIVVEKGNRSPGEN